MRTWSIALCLTLVSFAALAQSKPAYTTAEMQTLLGKGLSVASMDIDGGKKYTGRVNLEPGGRLTGALNVSGHGTVPLNGTWKLQGAQVCRTLGEVQPELICETWIRSGAKEATVQVDGKNVSINRW
jgi:hypothetical protein